MKKLISILLALVMLLSLAACGGSSSDTETTPETVADDIADTVANEVSSGRPTDGNGKIGFSTITLGAEFFSNLDNAVHNRLEAQGYEVVTVSCEGNAAQQVADIENLIAMECEAIFFFATDPDALTDVLLRGREAGIKMYGIACTIENTEAYDKILNTDQYASGVGVAELANAWIEENYPDAEPGSIEVALIVETSTPDSNKRSNGMRTIAELSDKVTIVGEYDLASAADPNLKAQEFAEMMQGQHPELKLILCYGCDSALGSNEVYMRDATLNRDEFAIFGVDTSEAVYNAIAASMNNESLIRGTVSLGDDLSLDVWECLIDADVEYMDENKSIFKPVKLIDIKNIGDYVG